MGTLNLGAFSSSPVTGAHTSNVWHMWIILRWVKNSFAKKAAQPANSDYITNSAGQHRLKGKGLMKFSVAKTRASKIPNPWAFLSPHLECPITLVLLRRSLSSALLTLRPRRGREALTITIMKNTYQVESYIANRKHRCVNGRPALLMSLSSSYAWADAMGESIAVAPYTTSDET